MSKIDHNVGKNADPIDEGYFGSNEIVASASYNNLCGRSPVVIEDVSPVVEKLDFLKNIRKRLIAVHSTDPYEVFEANYTDLLEKKGRKLRSSPLRFELSADLESQPSYSVRQSDYLDFNLDIGIFLWGPDLKRAKFILTNDSFTVLNYEDLSEVIEEIPILEIKSVNTRAKQCQIDTLFGTSYTCHLDEKFSNYFYEFETTMRHFQQSRWRKFINHELIRGNLEWHGEDSLRRNKDVPFGYFGEDFELISLIGNGGHAFVYSCKHKPSGTLKVAKFCSIQRSSKFVRRQVADYESSERITTELDTLLFLNGCSDSPDSLPRLHSYYVIEDYVVMVFDSIAQELENVMDLFSLIENHAPGEAPISWNMIHGLTEGFAFLHRNGRSHGDVKDENIAVGISQSDKNELKLQIIDFGSVIIRGPNDMSKLWGSVRSDFVGTMRYAAPEVLMALNNSSNKRKHSNDFLPEFLSLNISEKSRNEISMAYDPEKQDMWAFGNVIFILVFGDDPDLSFGNSWRYAARQISGFDKGGKLLRNCASSSPEYVDEKIEKILDGLLDPNPNTRWNSNHLLKYLEKNRF